MFRRFLENRGSAKRIEDSEDGPISLANSSLSEDTSKQNESSFVKCVEAYDDLASTGISSGRVDPKTGLIDCSVLVSADGELLIIPRAQQLQTEESRKDQRTKSILERTSNDFGEEYQSAVFMGNDLDVLGDQGLNGFSAKGWSLPAATLAVKQSADAMGDFADFLERLLVSKKSAAANESRLMHQLTPLIEGKTHIEEYSKLLAETFPAQDLDLPSTRVGPISFQHGTIQSEMVALKHYYTSIAQIESKRWRAVAAPTGALTKLREAKIRTDQRESNRRMALQEMLEKKQFLEQHLVDCKETAARKWNEVHDTEEKVTRLLEEKMLERSRLKEQKRIERMKQAEEKRIQDSPQRPTTSSEILDIVSAVTASMEEGSFEPMDLPQMPFAAQMEQAQIGDMQDPDGPYQSRSEEEDLPISLPMASRHDLEDECDLPQLRVAALTADDAVEDAGISLLSFLKDWDVTRRSARLAAETCLIGSCNAQAQCLRSIIEGERQALKERTELLDNLEAIAFDVDIRGDIDNYIKQDKKESGGTSFLGDDDDGGLAAALTVIETYSDGNFGTESDFDDSVTSSQMNDDEQLSPEHLEEAIDSFFTENPLLGSNADSEEGHHAAMDEFENTVSRLCAGGNERLLRSTICFALNAKRNHHDEIPTMIQFIGLCRLFSALLGGCETSGSGASLAKMLMKLSQRFYLCESVSNDEGEPKKTFVKTHLVNHPLWENDELW